MKILSNSNHTGARLDAFVQQSKAISRSLAQQLIHDGKVTVNEKVEKVSYKIRAEDKINIDFDESSLAAIPDIKLPIIYEDNDCIVLDKPAGILTHSKGAYNPEATVASYIKSKLSDLAGDRAGIVHRLDRATSGLIICAKNPAAMQWLQKQFAQRKVKKTYIALTQAGLKPQKAIIDMPIERDPKQPKKFRVGSNGKIATTEYRIVKTKNKIAQIELRPITGRTHQIRVHLKQIGYPIMGDTLYGGKKAKRLMLHAYKLEVTLPNKERKLFESKLPSEFTL